MKITWSYHGKDNMYHVFMNDDIEIYYTEDARDRDLFIAELKMREIMVKEQMLERHFNLLDIGILLKHFFGLFMSQTDMGNLKTLETLAKSLDKSDVYGGLHKRPETLKLIDGNGHIYAERTWNYGYCYDDLIKND